MQEMVQMLHSKIVHHFLLVIQTLMKFLLMKQIIFTLQFLCTIWMNIDTSGSLWQLKRDKFQPDDANLNINNSQLFKCNAALVGKTSDVDDENIFVKNTKIVVPLIYLGNFWRSLGSHSSITFFFIYIHIITFTRLNVNNLQSPGNLNSYITWKNSKWIKI